MLIGLTGKARSGKDTSANFMVDEHGFNGAAFAAPLKVAASVIFGLPLEHFYEDDLKEVVDSFWNLSPRQMLQKLGTEACRKVFSEDIWIRSLENSFQQAFDASYNLVITDVRFDNEADFIRSKGGVIVHVVSGRESTLETSAQNHSSEAGVTFKEGDQILNNRGSIADLGFAVDHLITVLKA